MRTLAARAAAQLPPDVPRRRARIDVALLLVWACALGLSCGCWYAVWWALWGRP